MPPKEIVKKILVPVQPDAISLCLVKQAAGLAKVHGAELLLLHVADIRECPHRFFSFFTRKGAEHYHQLTAEKKDLFNTWKRWTEKEYTVTTRVRVEWGNRKKNILAYAEAEKADMIAIAAGNNEGRDLFGKRYIEQVIDQSPCQVVSFLSSAYAIEHWKQVVMPVTDFVPEKRISAIADIARNYQLKIHLVALASQDKGQHANDFYFLTETLKKLKHVGNIQVTCKCLKENNSQTSHFLRYAREIGADLLMTSRGPKPSYEIQPSQPMLFEYI